MNYTNEKEFHAPMSGFAMIAIMGVLLSLSVFLFFSPEGLVKFFAFLLLLINIFLIFGFMQIEPNDVRIMIFFGKYKGTFKEVGFFWVNPFYVKARLTQRARNMDIEPIKVNDKAGNPVMIGLVLVWKVKDTYKAMFEIDSSAGTSTVVNNNLTTFSGNGKAMAAARMSALQRFVSIQSDSALRNIASEYAYDNNEVHDEVTLRSGSDGVAERLETELNKRLDIAGIEVIEARINYLAYAPEIAAVMLRRQQAAAIISAREKIVEGAVGMVRMALDKLKWEGVVELDEDKKAAMVSNLLVVLCSEEQTHPIVNTGTLHH